MVKKKESSNLVKKIVLRNVPKPPILKKKEELIEKEDKSVIKESSSEFVNDEVSLFNKLNHFYLRKKLVLPPLPDFKFTYKEKDFLVVKEIPIEESVEDLFVIPIREPDSLEKTKELLGKFQRAVLRKKPEQAYLYYEQLKPFYLKLQVDQQQIVSSILVELLPELEMLQLGEVSKKLKKQIALLQ